MNRLVLIFVLSLVAATTVSAQSVDKTVEAIRIRYIDIAEKVRLCESEDDKGQFGELVMNELSINSQSHQWRAVGIYGQTFRFFYKGGDSEAHLDPDQLVMVETERRSSNRTYHEEFLYSDAGVLMFYFQKAENDDRSPAERRVYFSGAKPIRIVEDGKTGDTLSAKDKTAVTEITAMSGKLKGIFNTSIKL